MHLNDKCFDLNAFSRTRNYLFGLAAFSIIAFHYSYDVWKNLGNGTIAMGDSLFYPVFNVYYLLIRSIGVEVFLFLSGMGLYYSYSRNPDPKRFWKKRFARVCIPYLLCAGPYWFIRDVILRGEELIRVPLDFFFVTFFTEGQRMIWFICFILIGYAIYPLIYRFLYNTEHQKSHAVILMAAGILLPVLYYLLAHKSFVLTNIASLRIPIFLLGCIMGKPIMEHRKVPMTWVYAIIAASLVLRAVTCNLDISSVFARYMAGLFSIGLMLLLVVLMDGYEQKKQWKDNLLMRVLNWAGAYSLEFYLVHVCLRNIFKNLHLNVYEPQIYLIIVIITIPAGVLLAKVSTSLMKRIIL